jgi:hypothetical protein
MIALLTAAASASTWSAVPDLAELAARSEAVVHGEVVSATAAPAPWGVSTRYEIRVEETLAGTASGHVTVDLPGGHWDGRVQRFGGVPLWEEGDQVVVFLPRPGERPSLGGALTVGADDALLDPLRRPAAPQQLEELRKRVRTSSGAADSPRSGAERDQ